MKPVNNPCIALRLCFSAIALSMLFSAGGANAQVGGVGIGEGSSSTPPNVIVIVLDDADLDVLNIDITHDHQDNGTPNEFNHFPNMKRLATEGIRFTNFHNVSPVCGPSRACFYSSMYPHNNDFRVHGPDTPQSRGVDGAFPIFYDNYRTNELGYWMNQPGNGTQYHTMMVGKYLHEKMKDVLDVDPDPNDPNDDNITKMPGWDEFYASNGGLYYNTYRFRYGTYLPLTYASEWWVDPLTGDGIGSCQNKQQDIDYANDFPAVTEPQIYRTRQELYEIKAMLAKHDNVNPSKPFMLYYAPIAPHREAANEMNPEKMKEKAIVQEVVNGALQTKLNINYSGYWIGSEIPKPSHAPYGGNTDKAFNEQDFTDKPDAYSNIVTNQKLPLLNATQLDSMKDSYRNRLVSMISVDDLVGEILDIVEANPAWADNTIIMLTSDNGYHLGHHRQSGKRDAFRRSSNTPLFVWGKDIPQGKVAHHLLGNIDVGPTILDLTGKTIPAGLDGKSFKNVLLNPESTAVDSVRSNLLVQNWDQKNSFGNRMNMTYVALHKISNSGGIKNEVFVEWANGEEEYYNVGQPEDPSNDDDPLQLQNDVSNPLINKIALRDEIRSAKDANNDGNPVVWLEFPFYQDTATGKTVEFKGIAEDSDQVTEVRVTIRDPNFEGSGQEKFWDGDSWEDNWTYVTATLNNPNGTVTEWTKSITFPEPTTATQLLLVSARSFDNDNNYTDPIIIRFFIDNTDPATTISTPTNGQTTSANPVNFTGSATDNVGVDEVRLVLKNTGTGQWWDGAAWDGQYAQFDAELDSQGEASTTWSYAFNNLPNGNYYFSARSYDNFGNYQDPPAQINFTKN